MECGALHKGGTLPTRVGRWFSVAGEIPVWAAIYSVSFWPWPCLASAWFGGLFFFSLMALWISRFHPGVAEVQCVEWNHIFCIVQLFCKEFWPKKILCHLSSIFISQFLERGLANFCLWCQISLRPFFKYVFEQKEWGIHLLWNALTKQARKTKLVRTSFSAALSVTSTGQFRSC